jgi:sugar lactone lactonase YvrE
LRGQHELRLFAEGLKFPEGPRWHAGRLWLSDVHRHEVLSFSVDGNATVEMSIDDRPSGLGFSPQGAPMVVAMTHRQVLIRGPDDRPRVWADLTAIPGAFANDMVVDSEGGAYVGNRVHAIADSSGSYPPSDSLIRIMPDGSVSIAADELVTPNGAVITRDGRLVVAETRAGRLTGFAIGADGRLTNRHIFANLPGEVPDGICLDAEGAIWVGSPLRSVFLRVREGGEITDRIPSGDRWAVAPALGGESGHTLFLLTTAITLPHLASLRTPAEDYRSMSEGRVYATSVEVPADVSDRISEER